MIGRLHYRQENSHSQADHGAHEDYRIEWWYYTGNLESENGRRFGYQLTFFRTGLHKQPTNPSKWAVRDLYTAHFAISDIGNQQHDCFQRNNRQGIGQAGAESERYEVWNGDWKVWLSGENHRLRASESDVAIDLTLTPTKPPVLHGERGSEPERPDCGQRLALLFVDADADGGNHPHPRQDL